jgi:DNA-binding CsgD family transcriptional regulator
MHKNKEYLQKKIEEGYTPKDISKELHVSYKLVEIYLKQFGIPFTPTKI